MKSPAAIIASLSDDEVLHWKYQFRCWPFRMDIERHTRLERRYETGLGCSRLPRFGREARYNALARAVTFAEVA